MSQKLMFNHDYFFKMIQHWLLHDQHVQTWDVSLAFMLLCSLTTTVITFCMLPYSYSVEAHHGMSQVVLSKQHLVKTLYMGLWWQSIKCTSFANWRLDKFFVESVKWRKHCIRKGHFLPSRAWSVPLIKPLVWSHTWTSSCKENRLRIYLNM